MSAFGKEWGGGKNKNWRVLRFLNACASGCYKQKIGGIWKCIRCGETGL